MALQISMQLFNHPITGHYKAINSSIACYAVMLFANGLLNMA